MAIRDWVEEERFFIGKQWEVVKLSRVDPYEVKLVVNNRFVPETTVIPFDLFVGIRNRLLPDNYAINAEELADDALFRAKEVNSDSESPLEYTTYVESLVRLGAIAAATVIKENGTP